MKDIKEVISGTIIPISWSRTGEVKKFGVYTYDGEDIILRHHYGPKLIKSLLNKEVKIFGSTIGEIDNCRIFSAKRIIKMKFKEGVNNDYSRKVA